MSSYETLYRFRTLISLCDSPLFTLKKATKYSKWGRHRHPLVVCDSTTGNRRRTPEKTKWAAERRLPYIRYSSFLSTTSKSTNHKQYHDAERRFYEIYLPGPPLTPQSNCLPAEKVRLFYTSLVVNRNRTAS